MRASQMPIWFMIATYSHESMTARLRSRLSPKEDLRTEALRLTGEIYADHTPLAPDLIDDEAPSPEQEKAETFGQIFEELSAAEGHIWGIAIASLYHQWERHTKHVLLDIRAPDAPRLDAFVRFDQLCDAIGRTGYDVRSSQAFDALHVTNLIANTVKHGQGRSFDELAALCPELFRGPLGTYVGKPLPELLSLDQRLFDRAANVIATIWREFGARYDAPVEVAPRAAGDGRHQ